MKVFASKKNRKWIKSLMISAGGGSVIDEAKIYAKRHNKILIAIPTTASGSSMTSHSVKWGKTKENIPTDIPITILPPVEINLDMTTRKNTEMDVLCHCLDVIQKMTNNDLIELGTQIGYWLEKYGSGLTHKRSYPYTLTKGMTHGEALRHVITECIEEAYPLKERKR